MKRTFFKPILPLIAVALSVFSAFAFKPATDKSANTIVFGATKSGINCTQIDKECQVEGTEHPCLNGSTQLWRFVNGTSCPNMLYEIEQ